MFINAIKYSLKLHVQVHTYIKHYAYTYIRPTSSGTRKNVSCSSVKCQSAKLVSLTMYLFSTWNDLFANIPPSKRTHSTEYMLQVIASYGGWF